MKVAVHAYHASKAWPCICVGVEPPFSKSWIRHCIISDHEALSCNLCMSVLNCYSNFMAYTKLVNPY